MSELNGTHACMHAPRHRLIHVWFHGMPDTLAPVPFQPVPFVRARVHLPGIERRIPRTHTRRHSDSNERRNKKTDQKPTIQSARDIAGQFSHSMHAHKNTTQPNAQYIASISTRSLTFKRMKERKTYREHTIAVVRAVAVAVASDNTRKMRALGVRLKPTTLFKCAQCITHSHTHTHTNEETCPPPPLLCLDAPDKWCRCRVVGRESSTSTDTKEDTNRIVHQPTRSLCILIV